MKTNIIAILLCLLLVACSDKQSQLQPNTPVGNFDAFWNIIDQKYCFIEDKQIDWNQVYADYRPQIDTLNPKQERELFKAMAECIDLLKDGHVNLYSPFNISHSSSWWNGYPANFNSNLLFSDKYLGKNYQIAGGLYYNRIAQDSIGLIRYSSFSSGFSALNMLYVLNYFSSCRGIVIDVRNNGGGDLENAYKLAATFFTKNQLVGYWQHKTGKGHHDFSTLEPLTIDTADMPCRWLKPVVVLCNRQTYSAANFFVNAMRYADNCVIVGGITGGGGGMPLSYELPNGWMIRFSAIRMFDASKNSIEDGILPDQQITLVSDDKDDLIEYSIAAINSLYK